MPITPSALPAQPADAPTDTPSNTPPDAARVLAETRAWIDRAVIGLNLCPFAKAVQTKGLIRYVHTGATDTDALAEVLITELQRLAETPVDTIETTVLVHPQVLQAFDDYNDFLDVADAAVSALGLDGVLQVASFHPDYRFADAPEDDISHATNRSPWPTLHLIRESSIDRAVEAFPEAETIYETNIDTLRRLGAAGWAALQQQCRDDARAAAGPSQAGSASSAAGSTSSPAAPAAPGPAG
ncbi:DUF1415 domain-containing protein [Aquabacterium sp. OR-4]|uniref:DUF1415 domain-containing protein n=1 Tax=Aquabacterium sp. OR-4 TaxID=2978127 RepID=UPI0028C8507A|nr:DUF1415 domain-containing protein [Aquabacterium sp. OR-4]MDT7835211.1 DUF1415 domain-containing protein [Aquabacterium sp. OR-4]